MNKRISLFLFILGILIAACTPKAGDKAAGNKTVAATGQSPVIPVPSGDVRSKAPKAGNAPKIQIGKAETFTLDNGLKVIVVENHKLPTVSYQVFVDNDPVLERDAAGYADLMGELLMKGTTTRTKAQIDGEVDFIGASLSTSNNGATGRCLSKHSDKLLAILSDVVMHPAFPQEELDKAKTRAQANLAQQKDDADQIADNVGAVLAYGSSHPYGEIMTEETLAKINLDQIKKQYSTFFKPNIAYLVVVGDVTKSQAEKYAKKYFSAWQRGDAPAQPHPAPRAPEKSQVSFVHKPGAVQSVINITYPVDLKPGTTEAIRARIANAVLGGYFNSRVNANLREGHGWTYGARTGITPDELVGIFSGTASVRNAVTDSSIIEFLKEMDRMRTEKVGADELQVVKNVLAGSFSQSLEQPGTVASFALNTARFGLPADFYEKYLETLQGITADEVLMAAKKYIRPDRAHIVIVGNRDDVADRVKQFSADGKISYYDAFGKPVRNLNRNI
ncbi:MAG: insulinase family protein, partial [Saprospiraceae bacterium]|nr:insulinase family protein [Saprospiraceae bacterium]